MKRSSLPALTPLAPRSPRENLQHARSQDLKKPAAPVAIAVQALRSTLNHSRLALGTLLGALSVLSALASAQTQHEVRMNVTPVEGRPVPEFFFEPTGLLIRPGDTVTFIAASPHHTATAYHARHVKAQRVPEGVEPFSSPVVAVGDAWTYTFTEPGVYDLWCGPHEQYGMAMRLVVGEASGPATEPVTDFGPSGVFATAGTVLNDPALDPQNIIARERVLWAELAAASKALTPPPAE